MAYKKADMINKCLKVIEKDDLVFIEQIITKVPFSSKTFYNHNLHEVQDIKDLLENNKTGRKEHLMNLWLVSDNATLQIALFKLLGTDEQYKRLANARQEIDQTNKNHHTVEYVNVSKDPKYKDQ